MNPNCIPPSREESDRIAEERQNAMLGEVTSKQLKYVNDVPVRHKYKTLVAFTSNSRSTGIEVKCLQCSNYQRDEIVNCHVESCGLYNFRPYKP